MRKNRIVPALLALCMVMSLLPVSVFADSPTPVKCGEVPSASEGAITGDETNGYAQTIITVSGSNPHTGTCKGGESCTCATLSESTADETKDVSNDGSGNNKTVRVTTKAYTWGSLCSACQSAGCNNEEGGDEEDPTPVSCSNATVAGVCKATEHNATCIEKCNGKADCPATNKHKADCLKTICACGCSVDAGCGCKVTGVNGEASDACPCASAVDGTTACCNHADCKYKICTSVNCSQEGKVVDTTSHTHDDVTTGACASGSEFNSKKVNCPGTTHHDGCPKMCPAEGCSQTVGHTAKHTSTEVCSNDSRCNVTADAANISKHNANCPVIKDVTPDSDKEFYLYEEEFATSVDCACNGYKHNATTKEHEGTAGADTCGKSITGTYTISMKLLIDKVTRTEGMTDAEYNAAVQAKVTEAKTTASSEITAAKETAENAWKDSQKTNGVYMCKACAKAVAADNAKNCTGTVECDIPANGTHKKDCLSLCTMSSTCKNSVGKSEAHKVYFRVEQIVADGPNTVMGTFPDRADAVAQLAALRAAVAPGATTKYQLVGVHCPQAGVADSVMVAADETAETTDPADPTTPEVKAPEKAEDFADLKGDEWYAEELTALVEKGIFTGSLDDGKYSFNATGNVTGAELVVLLSRVAGEDLVTTGTEWNKAATAWAAEAGYTEGVDITTTGKLTRQDVVLILWRAAGSPASEQSLEAFADAEGLEGDYLTAMKWAVEKEIIKGDGDTGALKAEDNITRAEMVAVLTRYSNVK